MEYFSFIPTKCLDKMYSVLTDHIILNYLHLN